ncbi:hypothetical protein HBH70_080030 [Parastagonospora nodorum]|nr:hypothetical protein HBH53_053450 [Parastagonospora nodorum]KAH4173847.1 hypothetical protein HBH43_083700 [Parastagonospora nodorum]KAH4210185.1 hypothetical protein HBI95_072100 [Parastagonospora nodorum]KAH4302454.1 hypothetical protein HBI02_138330 [Parastagonospora nodorum]KAH4305394.1 hypothetical protein HBI01_070210 [Parastagonospora nodorum]
MADENKHLKVLIVGSGIAGPALAYWLHTLLPTAHVTILERAPELRLGGQAVDIRSAALPIVEKMGLLHKVKNKTTTEVGMEFVYADGKSKATFPATGNDEQQSMTSEYEILRGDMAKILYDATVDMPNVEYMFDETVATIEQKTDGKVDITFANQLQSASYDLVVGADGMMSRTRRSVFGHGPNNDDYLNRLGQYGAFFKIPRTGEDTDYAQWWNASRGRLILKRPDQYGTTRVYAAITDSNLSRFDEIDKLLKNRSVQEQKEWLAREFEGAGWMSERIVKGMMECDDFYMQQIAQVKMPEWSKGHVALLGDAAYCPSPISGLGAGSGIVGAYVLAGEVSKSPEDIPAALKRYEARTRAFVDQVQKLIPGAPQCANPQTDWGIKLFNKTMGFISHPVIRKFGGLIGKFVPAFGGTKWDVPDYGVIIEA